jgi:predicted negative regulator of RcsB-dependent stress response
MRSLDSIPRRWRQVGMLVVVLVVLSLLIVVAYRM